MARAVRRAASQAVWSSVRPGRDLRTPPWSVSPSPPPTWAALEMVTEGMGVGGGNKNKLIRAFI